MFIGNQKMNIAEQRYGHNLLRSSSDRHVKGVTTASFVYNYTTVTTAPSFVNNYTAVTTFYRDINKGKKYALAHFMLPLTTDRYFPDFN